MKVGFCGRWDPGDKNAWSGIYYSTFREIRKYYEVEAFHYTWPPYIREWLILHKQVQKLSKRKVAVEFLKGYAKHFSRQLDKDLLKRKVDLLYVPAAPQLIAYCTTNIPVIFMTDATFLRIQGYYDSFQNLAPYNIRQGVEMDKRAFEKSAHSMLASEWAKDSAVKDYGIPPSKLTVAPFGANLDRVPLPNELKNGRNDTCKLLFIGVEWERKGGQIALDTFYVLQKSGVPVELMIIGCMPPNPLNDKNITVIPFLNRNIPEEATRLFTIFQNSDFLLLPTRAECAGIVFSEASAFGIPSVTTDTGGVKTYVENGVNGYTLPLTAGASDYATLIKKIYMDEKNYSQLCFTSRQRFAEQLNWETWGKTFCRIADALIN